MKKKETNRKQTHIKMGSNLERTIQCCFVAFCKREHTRFAYKYVFGLWLRRCPAAPTCPCAYLFAMFAELKQNANVFYFILLFFFFLFSLVGNIFFSRALSLLFTLRKDYFTGAMTTVCVRAGKRQFYWNAKRKMQSFYAQPLAADFVA